MKKTVLTAMVVFTVLLTITPDILAQADSSKSQFSAGADFYSNYIWRGSKFGNGPAFQPSVKYTCGIFSVGVWGSFDASGYTESDPFLSFSFPFGLSLGLTDYYYPGLGGSFFADSSNAYEINAGYANGGFSLSANYIINKAPLPASAGSDVYFQVGYAFKKFNIAVGAGNGWHTVDTKFNVCNVIVGTSQEIKLSDSFSIPVTGQVIVNPDKKQLFVVVGFTL